MWILLHTYPYDVYLTPTAPLKCIYFWIQKIFNKIRFCTTNVAQTPRGAKFNIQVNSADRFSVKQDSQRAAGNQH